MGREGLSLKIFTSIVLALPLCGAYAMFAVGIVVIYRASRILNLAHGAMAAVPAYLAYSLSRAGVPMAAVVPIAVASGALLGIIVQRAVLRPLRNESQTAQTVGTVAVLGILVALIAKVWGTAPLAAPRVFPDHVIPVGHSVLRTGAIGLGVVALVCSALIAALLRYTNFGLAMRGAADNPRAASLMGVNPDRTTAAAWAIGGAVAALSGVLLAGATNLEPYVLSRQVLPAFVAALLGGLGSLGGAVAGAIVVGVAQGVVNGLGGIGSQPGMAQLVLTVVAFAVMAFRGKKLAGTDDRAPRDTSMRKPRRFNPRSPWVWLVAAAALLWPLIPLPRSIADPLQADVGNAAIWTIVAVSLVLLTGWIGQISLAQASFVGLAAFVTGVLVRNVGIPFPLNLPIAAAVSGAAAVGLGMVALRVRGLYLAVATLIFGWMADAYLFKQTWLAGEGGSAAIGPTVVGRTGAIPSFDLTQRRVVYYVTLAGAALAIAACANLRDSRTGRAFFAVRGSELAAASIGINVTRTKLFAFAVSGVLAGIAGNLLMISHGIAGAEEFTFNRSLFFLAIAAIGGLTRLGGAVAAAVLFAALYEIFFRVSFLQGWLEVVSAVLLLAAVLAGSEPVRRRFKRGGSGAQPTGESRAMLAAPKLPERAVNASLSDDMNVPPAIDARDITVRFGGLFAVSEASLAVGVGEIVGLIGPNGAGKTTLFNAICGMNSPTSGSVAIFGTDASNLGVHERAALGVGRTFQSIQIFKDATVFDNLLVATHRHGKTGPASHLLLTDRALREEESARERVRAASAIVGLDDVLELKAGDLPFGVLRMVEVARALTTGAKLILLDEPASGLDELETQRLLELLLALREGLGLSLLVVEHDVRFVTTVCDHIFVLDQGKMIAHGTPAQIRNDPVVLAAYLGEPPAEELEDVATASQGALVGAGIGQAP